MIPYARRKKKKDLFVVWMALSAASFAIAGTSLRGVSAVRAVPILIDSKPSVLSVVIVDAQPEPIAVGGGSPEVVSSPEPGPVPVADLPPSPFESTDPIPLTAPEPLLPPEMLPEPEVIPDVLPDVVPEPIPEPEVIPEPVPVPEPIPEPVPEVIPEIIPEPIPEPVVEPEVIPEPVVEPEPEIIPEPPVKPKVEAKPPEPKKVEPKKSTPPKPKAAPRAAPLSSSNVVAERPKVRYRPPLRFPEKAKRRGIEGKLMLDVRVDNRGNVAGISIKKSSGHRILDSEAISAVKSWKFEPAKNAAGRAVATTIAVPVKFGYADAE